MRLLWMMLAGVILLGADTARVTQHFGVATTEVKREDVWVSREFYGYLYEDESRVYDLAPRYSGYVERLYANSTYSYVKKGELLARVYSAEVFKAKEEYLRSYRYNKSKSGSFGMLHSARRKLELLGVGQKEIEAVLNDPKTTAYTNIYAPKSGYIFVKNINQGSSFKRGETLFRIVDLDRVWLRFFVSDLDRSFIEGIKRLRVRFGGVDESYEASVEMIEPKLDREDARYIVRAILQNKKHGLYPGMYAKVEAIKDLGEHLVLPSEAVVRKDGRYFVFLVTEFEGEFEPLAIEAKRVGSRYIILSGLKEGERVASSALFMLDSDAQINALY